MTNPTRHEPTRRNGSFHAPRLLAWLLVIVPLACANAAEPARIGVLSLRPKPQTLAQWQALAAVLKRAIPERDFAIEALNHKELSSAVAARQLDFVVTSPSHYILLAKRSGLSAPLATVAENMNGKAVTALGGAIFSRADNTTINSLPDLKGRTIASISAESIYGYQSQAYELMRADIKLPQDARMLFTGTPNDAVIEAVLSGRAEAGFVRAGALEDMAHEGKLDMARVKVINRQPLPEYPVQVSTRIYPGRVFATLPHIDENLSRRVAAALFLLEDNRTVTDAMNIHGFVIPADYTVVSDMLRELRLPPFDATPEFTLHDVWHQYWKWILALLAGAALVSLLALWVLAANRKLKAARTQAANQLSFINAIVNAEVNGLAVCHAIAEPPHTRFTVWNPRMETLTGYSMEEINRLGWYQTVYPDPEVQEQARQRMERMRRGDHLCGEEWVITRKDGGQRTVQIYTVTVARDERGTHTLAIMRDVTERKRAEKELELSAQLLNSTSDTIFLLDPDGNFVYLNEAAWKSRGYTRDEMMKMNLRDLNVPEFNKLLAPRIKAVMESGYGFFESAHRRKDGSVMPVEINTRVIESGGRKLLLSAIRDITERKQAEEALRRSEAMLHTLYDSTSDAVLLLDKKGIFDCNKAALEIFGYTTKEALLSKSPADLSPTEQPRETESAMQIRQQIAEAMERESSIFEWTFQRADTGTVFLADVLLNSMVLDGRVVLQATIRDITERKKYEEELRRSNIELEQFGYAVSHDMRQPLRMITSYLQLIEMELGGRLDAEKRSYFDFAIEGAKRIDQMLVALLEYSRVGRIGAPPAWIDSRTILDEALQYLQPAIAEVQARVSITGEWPRVFVSRDEVLRLMQNMVGNAVKFRVAGRIPEIAVTSEVAINEWRFCVVDNGVGILPGQIKRLFQIFQRLQLRTAYEGNGVGLALCRKIAEHHNGRIWAESAGEGQGSKFCAALPVLREEAIMFIGENI